MQGDTDTVVWLRFVLTPGLGCRSRLNLLRELGSPDAILGASVSRLRECVDAKVAEALAASGSRENWPELDAHLAWLATPGNHLLTLADATYPRALLDLPDAPVALFIKGDAALLARCSLSVVGSRQSTPQGLENAEAFSATFSQSGYAIVSGLAAGIDSAAHRGGLAGMGSTVAVVGTGLDRVYPAANRELAHDIAARGTLVSEFPLGFPPRAEHFPRRNRLIAALGSGCLVVEATLGSGSLITAKQAAELGREVFAIPGSIHSPQSKGCHLLIKQGAKLAESAQDILEELSLPQLPGLSQPKAGASSNDEGFLQQLGWDPVDVDTLAGRTGMKVDELMANLLTLELDGQIVSLPGGRYQRRV